METTVQVEVRDGVQIMTLYNPKARNAVTQEMAEAMAAALDRLDSDPQLSVGIITGSEGTFCAGMDLKGFLQGRRPSVEGRGFCGLTTRLPEKPLIAAVEGYALAGGCEVVLACDLVVAASDARFGLPEVKRGLVAAAGGVLRLPQRLPWHIAMEVILTGEMLPAERAHAYGLVNRLSAPGAALEMALELAAAVAANGPLAVQASKRLVHESQNWSSSEMFDRQWPLASKILESEDAREGAAAFAEKRKPKWQGR